MPSWATRAAMRVKRAWLWRRYVSEEWLLDFARSEAEQPRTRAVIEWPIQKLQNEPESDRTSLDTSYL